MAAAFEVDFGPLQGFRFTCRPDCSLCCYATPAVSAVERQRLIGILPELPPAPPGEEFTYLPAREEGGACGLLKEARCQAHPLRPFPCRSYPVHTHFGYRVQLSLVLACPGLTPPEPSRWGVSGARLASPAGLDGELGAVREELAGLPVGAWIAEHAARVDRIARKLNRQGRWEKPADVLARLLADPPGPDPSGELSLPPTGIRNLEELPLFFDPKYGRVIIRDGEDGTYELASIREAGGIGDRLGRFALPEVPPALGAIAGQRLAGYARYLLHRDHFAWAALHELECGAEGTVGERLEEDLVEALTECVNRASVIEQLHGGSGLQLDEGALLQGLSSVDAELLDRPSLGRVL
jgi:Fe-S-cluster containining protein